MRKLSRILLVVLPVFLICLGVASADSDELSVGAEENSEMIPAVDDSPRLEPDSSLSGPDSTPVYYCGSEFTCRQACVDDCERDFQICQSSCGNPTCQRECWYMYQDCVDWCNTTF